MVTLELPPCEGCGVASTVAMDIEQYRGWLGGRDLHHLFPWWSDSDLNVLVDGRHGICRTKLDEEEDT